MASETPAFATVISLPIHPNTYTNDALIVGTLQAEGRCLFLVAIGGGSADVTLDNLWRTAWLVRPLPECLGDGFILAGSVSLAIPSTNP